MPDQFDITKFLLNNPALRFRFFGTPVEIFSDSPSYFDNFNRAYHRFASHKESGQQEKLLTFKLLVDPDNPWGEPVLIHGDSVLLLNSPWLFREVYVYESILAITLQHVRSHILIHAGAVAMRSHGVVLAADSGFGKTTLVLELVRRGFDLLSDELAALGRSDGLLHPFPRSLRIRPSSLPLLSGLELPNDTPTWTDKLLVDPEVLRKGCVGGPRHPRAVVILKTPAVDLDRPSSLPGRDISIQVAHLDERLLNFIRNHPDTLSVEIDPNEVYPSIHVRARRTALASEIEAFGRQNGMLILDIIRRDPGTPMFTGPAQLEEIPPTQMLVELMRRFEPGHDSDLMVIDYNSQSSRMFFELASILKNSRAFYLKPGPLPQMAELVESLVD